MDQVLTAEGGHAVTFYEESNGEIKAKVEVVDEKDKVFNGVPVVLEKGVELGVLPHLDKKTQQGRILIQSLYGKPTKIVIHQPWLMGGMEVSGSGENENVSGDDFFGSSTLGEDSRHYSEDEDGHAFDGDSENQESDKKDIFSAVKAGDIESLVSLLSNNIAGIYYKSNNGYTPLHYAVTNRNKEVVELLLGKELVREKGADVNSQYNLGCIYYNGKGVEKDDKEAVEWYKKAADQGDAHAQNSLGWMYREGRGVA